MTIPSTARKAGPFDGTGVQTEWPFTFKVFTETDVKVVIADALGVTTELVYLTDFTVAINADQESTPGGTVTYPISGTPLPNDGSVLSIVGNVSYEQALDLPSGGNFSPLAIENALDSIVMQIQQLAEEVSRAARLPVTNTEDAAALAADIVVLANNVSNMQTLVSNIADIVTVADDLNEPVSEINTVATDIANVNTVGTNISNVNTVAGINADVTTVAGIAPNVTTVAGINADVTTVAGVSANVTTVAGIAPNVTTVAGISGDVSAVAAINTSVSAVAAIDADVVAVAAVAADVSTVSVNILDVQTVADIAPAVSAVAAVDAEITTVAGNIAAILDAPAQASAAASSAVSAANSAAAAATALDNFDDRYLGQKTADPTVDNDGMALLTGALYFNTTTGKMRVYTGSGWIDASSASVATLATFNYVATAGQTTFSGNDAAGVNLVYTVGALIVTLNGIDLKEGVDYTASNGSSIVLTSGAAAGDELRVYAFGNFQVADTYSQAAADAKFLAKTGGTMSGELVVPSLKGATGNKLQLRSGDSSYGVSLQNISGIDLLAVDATGRVTMPYQPALVVRVDSSKSTSASASLAFDTIVLNRNNAIASSLSNSRFTVPISGYYRLDFSAFLTSSGNDSAMDLRVNGSGTYRFGHNLNGLSGTASNLGVAASFVLSLAANDYIEIFASSPKQILGSSPTHSAMAITLVG